MEHPQTMAGAGKCRYFMLLGNSLGFAHVQRSCTSPSLFCSAYTKNKTKQTKKKYKEELMTTSKPPKIRKGCFSQPVRLHRAITCDLFWHHYPPSSMCITSCRAARKSALQRRTKQHQHTSGVKSTGKGIKMSE